MSDVIFQVLISAKLWPIEFAFEQLTHSAAEKQESFKKILFPKIHHLCILESEIF